MKKYSTLLGAALSLFALASCQKEADVLEPDNNVNKHVPFELKAEVPATKTTLDAKTWKMAWENGDVMYAVTTDEEWGKAYSSENPNLESIAEFTYNGTNFATTSKISDGEHAFNFLYTANESQKTYHRGAATSFSLSNNQIMDASAPTAAIKVSDALVGQVTATTPTTFANVQMNHLFTLMKVTLKNKTGEDVIITSFNITAEGANLAGIFSVTFGETPAISLKQSGKDNVSVEISNGEIAANGELPVYFVMAPLSNYSGAITFTATDSFGRVYSKTNTVSGVTFNAGEYNTATHSLNPIPDEVVSLDWIYAGGTASDLNAEVGVSTNGLGTDYAESHGAYRVKFDTEGDYIQVKTDQAIGSVKIGVKMIGGADTAGNGAINVMESKDGQDYSLVQSLTISGNQNTILSLSSTNAFDPDARYVRFVFHKKVNVGVGPISVLKVKDNDPSIVSEDITGVAVVGGSFSSSYTLSDWDGEDDVTAEGDGTIVTSAEASNGTITYTVAPNYTKSTKNGYIRLSSASNGVDKTISVSQLPSSGLSVSDETVTIPVDATTATFTLTTADFGWNSEVTPADDLNLSIDPESGAASDNAQTITVSSTVAAASNIQNLGTIVLYRNGNENDSQKKTITVKKAARQEEGTKTSTLIFTAACGGSGTADDSTVWTVTSDGTESSFDSTKGIHYGTGSAQVQYIKLSTSGITGTITKVVVNASTASGVSATADVTVGGDAFGGDPQSLSASAADYTFTGSASGEIVVTVTKPSKATKAIYVKSIAVTYK